VTFPGVLYLAAAYLMGSLPTGYLAGRWLKGMDIRTAGSGNTGATNVFRLLGPKAGIAVLLIDMAKGCLAVTWLAGAFGLSRAGWHPLAGALAVVLGHNYTCFLRFKGGKGVATSAGVLFGLAPYSATVCLLTFAAAFAATRMVSVGSLAGATILPLAVMFWNEGGQGTLSTWQPKLWLSVVLAAFVWIRHVPNLKRLAAGKENRLDLGRRQGADKETQGARRG
jgi:glycerol-3-phosphate acyltransferase PlsY